MAVEETDVKIIDAVIMCCGKLRLPSTDFFLNLLVPRKVYVCFSNDNSC